MRIVVSTIGSWGDLFPLIPVAKRLAERGHTVTFAAPSAMREVIEQEGFAFHAVGDGLSVEDHWSHPEIVDRRLSGLAGFRAMLKRFILPRLPDTYNRLTSACSDADALIAHPAQLAAPMVAESSGLPWVTVSMFPGLLPSRETVPQGSVQPALPGPIGRSMNAAAWALTEWILRGLVDRRVNAERRDLGFGPIRGAITRGSRSPVMTVLLSSTRYTPRPSDWSSDIVLAGFSQFDRPAAWEADRSAVAAFVAGGDPPVVLTLGFTGAIDPKDAFTIGVQAIRSTGRRALVLVARRDLVFDGGDGVLVCRFVPLSTLVSRAPAIIHAGGYGSTVSALSSGTPSVVVPLAHDQLFHASRLRSIGVARTISPRRLSPSRLAREVERVVRDPFRTRARELAAQLGEEDGPGNAADAIEKALGV